MNKMLRSESIESPKPLACISQTGMLVVRSYMVTNSALRHQPRMYIKISIHG
jgi:hypothetical protein